ncbi:MAG TPA: hypothetical protein VF071_02580 [Candidatus Limnocylindria bacterium]
MHRQTVTALLVLIVLTVSACQLLPGGSGLPSTLPTTTESQVAPDADTKQPTPEPTVAPPSIDGVAPDADTDRPTPEPTLAAPSPGGVAPDAEGLQPTPEPTVGSPGG